jgi:hypothetical protein
MRFGKPRPNPARPGTGNWVTVDPETIATSKKLVMQTRRIGGIFRFQHSFRTDWSHPTVPVILTLVVLFAVTYVAYS